MDTSKFRETEGLEIQPVEDMIAALFDEQRNPSGRAGSTGSVNARFNRTQTPQTEGDENPGPYRNPRRDRMMAHHRTMSPVTAESDPEVERMQALAKQGTEAAGPSEGIDADILAAIMQNAPGYVDERVAMPWDVEEQRQRTAAAPLPPRRPRNLR